MEFNLHIERLVLNGVEMDVGLGQSDLLQASVVKELTRLFDSGGLGANFVGGASLSEVATNSIHLSDGKPRALGKQIAQSVYGGIGRE